MVMGPLEEFGKVGEQQTFAKQLKHILNIGIAEICVYEQYTNHFSV